MKLQLKVYILLYTIVTFSILFTSYFLLKQTVKDKQSYVYDQHLNQGLMYSNALKLNIDIDSTEALKELLSQILDGNNDQKSYNFALYDRSVKSLEVLNSIAETNWSTNIILPEEVQVSEYPLSFSRGGYVVSAIPLTKNFVLIISNPDIKLFKLFVNYLKSIFPYILLIFLMVGLLGWILSKKITKPLKLLQEKTKALAKGHWEIQLPNYNTFEINELTNSFNNLGRELYDREQEILSKERLSAMGQFSAGIAHELKNPLNIISSYSQLLQRKLEDESKQYKQAVIIENEVERATKIINELMNFSRQKPLALTEVLAKSFFDRVAENFNAIKPSQVSFTITIEDPEYKIKIDEEMFFQVIINLLENASHALIDNSIEQPSVKIKVTQSNTSTSILLEDNGLGVPEEIQGKIFEPFFTTKSVGKGTGLGLAFCSGVVKQHLGQLRYENVDKSQFIITLPN